MLQVTELCELLCCKWSCVRPPIGRAPPIRGQLCNLVGQKNSVAEQLGDSAAKGSRVASILTGSDLRFVNFSEF